MQALLRCGWQSVSLSGLTFLVRHGRTRSFQDGLDELLPSDERRDVDAAGLEAGSRAEDTTQCVVGLHLEEKARSGVKR